ncbi:hypothetical protein [Novosphingobium clariflavum]|uniref:Uncharacterized protein n=1 Tax=Novosphingobium clariflavum TaxID=2029884 RepID=A0ABV6S1U9_9SPHN|nr:hypothetical protein [Novosphingobium clariflavum]
MTMYLAPHLASEFLNEITKRANADFAHNKNPLFSLGYYKGIRIEPHSVFPTEHSCTDCSGSGEGVASTYCKPCGGAGRRRVVGMVDTILITEPLPKKFAPYFPRGIVASPPPCRGLA